MTTTTVVDPADPRLADYRLLADPSARRAIERDTFFVVEGLVAVARLTETAHRLRSALVLDTRWERFAPLAAAFQSAGAPVHVVSRDVMRHAVGFDLHRGVIASADRSPLPTVGELAAAATRLAVLEGLNDAENVGLIARAARALGVGGLVLDPRCTDPYSRRSIRVSLGEILKLPVARASTEEWSRINDLLTAAGFETWALTPAADADDLWALLVPARVAVLLGAEGDGLRTATATAATRRVRIPIDPEVDSLNVGHAAAIAFAAVARSGW
jgi:tRNA G18 (ribose-2'-O)-methylase SpoU